MTLCIMDSPLTIHAGLCGSKDSYVTDGTIFFGSMSSSPNTYDISNGALLENICFFLRPSFSAR